jgi:Beta-propeller repeat
MKNRSGLLIVIALSGASALATQPQFPAFFVENHGQAPSTVRYVMRRPSGTVFFASSGLTIALPETSLEMRFVNGAVDPSLQGRAKLSAVANFFEGSNPSKWRSNATLFQQLVYKQLWPGIDAVYSTTKDVFKSEFRVAPGASAALIRWNYGAASQVRKKVDGSIEIRVGGETVHEEAPEVYQLINGNRVPVASDYDIEANGDVGFKVGPYDSSAELVIDPVIVFTSLLGGSSQDQASAVAADAYGNVVVAGWTSSTNFPVMAASRQPQFGGSVDAFVAKFGGNGSDLIFCTFIGGNGDDRATGLALDTAGNIYVAGHTASTNFPIVSAVQTKLNGPEDAFVAKLNPAGTKLLYSTFFGGSNVDAANAIAVDIFGQAYIGGDTSSTDLPILNGAYTTNQGGQDGFVAKFTSAGTAVVYSTYLGGTAADHIAAIAVDTAGNTYVTGSTFSVNFPVSQAVQAATGGNQDAFVTEILPGGNALVFSTYLGGSGGFAGLPEAGQAIALDIAGNIYVAGTTSSSNFPVTASALQPTFAGGNVDGFLTQYAPGGQRMNYSSFLGGSGLDLINGIAADSFGYVSVTGQTSSIDFPVARGVQKQLNGNYDAFVTKFLFNGSTCALVNSSYLGGSGNDSATGIALNRNGDALVAGLTGSYDFPIVVPLSSTKAFQSTNLGLTNAFVAKLASPFFPAAYSQGSNGPLINLDYAHDALFDGEIFTGKSTHWGNPGDVVILGDWNQTGTVKVGVFRNGLWILDSNGNGVLDAADRQFNFGQAGDIPVVGDWNGTGTLKAGVFRSGTWILDLSGLVAGQSTGLGNIVATYGVAGDIPVVGDWTGTGTSKIGVFRNGFWILDANGDYAMTGSDPFYVFGQAGDTPLTGDWDGSGISHPGIVRNNHWFLNYRWANETGALGSAGTELKFTFGATGSVPLVGKVY